jgi:hypothetical protein
MQKIAAAENIKSSATAIFFVQAYYRIHHSGESKA